MLYHPSDSSWRIPINGNVSGKKNAYIENIKEPIQAVTYSLRSRNAISRLNNSVQSSLHFEFTPSIDFTTLGIEKLYNSFYSSIPENPKQVPVDTEGQLNDSHQNSEKILFDKSASDYFYSFLHMPDVYLNDTNPKGKSKVLDTLPCLIHHNCQNLNNHLYVIGGLCTLSSIEDNLPKSYLQNEKLHGLKMSDFKVHFPYDLPSPISKTLLSNPLLATNSDLYIMNNSTSTLTFAPIANGDVPPSLLMLSSSIISKRHIFYYGGFSLINDRIEFDQSDKKWTIYKRILVNNDAYILDTVTLTFTKVTLKSRITQQQFSGRIGNALVSNVYDPNADDGIAGERNSSVASKSGYDSRKTSDSNSSKIPVEFNSSSDGSYNTDHNESSFHSNIKNKPTEIDTLQEIYIPEVPACLETEGSSKLDSPQLSPSTNREFKFPILGDTNDEMSFNIEESDVSSGSSGSDEGDGIGGPESKKDFQDGSDDTPSDWPAISSDKQSSMKYVNRNALSSNFYKRAGSKFSSILNLKKKSRLSVLASSSQLNVSHPDLLLSSQTNPPSAAPSPTHLTNRSSSSTDWTTEQTEQSMAQRNKPSVNHHSRSSSSNNLMKSTMGALKTPMEQLSLHTSFNLYKGHSRSNSQNTTSSLSRGTDSGVDMDNHVTHGAPHSSKQFSSTQGAPLSSEIQSFPLSARADWNSLEVDEPSLNTNKTLLHNFGSTTLKISEPTSNNEKARLENGTMEKNDAFIYESSKSEGYEFQKVNEIDDTVPCIDEFNQVKENHIKIPESDTIANVVLFVFGGYTMTADSEGSSELKFQETNEMLRIELIVNHKSRRKSKNRFFTFSHEAIIASFKDILSDNVHNEKSNTVGSETDGSQDCNSSKLWPSGRGFFGSCIANSKHLQGMTTFPYSSFVPSSTAQRNECSESNDGVSNPLNYYEDKILIIHGGIHGYDEIMSDLFIFTFKSCTWEKIQTYSNDPTTKISDTTNHIEPTNVSMCFHQMIPLGDYMLMSGGLTRASLNSVKDEFLSQKNYIVKDYPSRNCENGSIEGTDYIKNTYLRTHKYGDIRTKNFNNFFVLSLKSQTFFYPKYFNNLHKYLAPTLISNDYKMADILNTNISIIGCSSILANSRLVMTGGHIRVNKYADTSYEKLCETVSQKSEPNYLDGRDVLLGSLLVIEIPLSQMVIDTVP